MGKKNWAKTWVNQGELGREFGLSAVMIGRKLDAGLREDRQPTKSAFDGGLAHAAPLASGTPIRWHKQKTVAALVAAGLTRLPAEEVRAAGLDTEAQEKAREIVRLE